MPDYQKLSESLPDENLKKIFGIISARQLEGAADSADGIRMTPDDTLEIQALSLDSVRMGMALDGGFTTVDEARTSVCNKLGSFVADSFFNSVNGTGTSLDPGYYNDATIPVSMSPNEATAYYTSGGIGARIIDLKSQGILVNGYRFLADDWNQGDLDRLKEYSDSIGFDKTFIEATRDGLIYGGSLLVPALKKDDALSYAMSFDELVKNGYLVKDSITRFWEADRWNAIMVPDYNISAADYLTPKSIFVPITGKEVNTSRASIIRPKQLPYWGTLRQMGWGISDMEGWIRALLAYEVCIASIPIMAQQASLLYRFVPLDGIVAQNGPGAARQWAEQLASQMREMSNVNPKVFNMVGELKAIERTYTGFTELVGMLERSLGAKADVPSSVLFHDQAQGLNASNQSDTTLKQAATIQNIGNKIIPQLSNVVKMMVYSCFGPDSEQAKKADKVRIDFDSPVVLTNEERNAAGTTFSAVFSALFNGGLQPADAIEIAQSFTPDIELPQSVIDKLNAVPELGMEGEAVHELAERLQGGTDGVANLAARLKPDSVSALAEKVKPPSLFDRLKPAVSKLFKKVAKVE